jgi:very-short-patch-repair endonuclease
VRPNEAVYRIIRRQSGAISRGQALDAGLSASHIQRQIESGKWLRLTPGVYAPAGSVATWERQLNAALLSHPGSIVAGLSAARLLGFANIGKGMPEILMPFDGNGRSNVARVIRARHFDTVERRAVEGYECTSPAETVLTISMRWPRTRMERIVDEGLARGLLRVADFDNILDRLAFARQPGLKTLRRIVGERADNAYQPPTNELERLLFRLLDHPRLPAYTRQLPIEYPGLKATVDAFLAAWKLIVEADGRRWHTRKEDFERDRLRDNAAVAAGLSVVRFTWKSLRFDVDRCLETLLEVGARRAVS